VKTYWWKLGGGRENAGDYVTKPILEHFGFEVEHSGPAEAEFMGSGSILSRSPGFTGIAIGTGTLDPKPLELKADIRCVRGPRTAQALDVWAPYADFGLLATVLLDQRPEPTYDQGWIPHWSDDREVPGLRIDITADPVDILRDIASCKRVVTSSLHGMVFADALSVPSLWRQWLGRDDHKFTDYAQGMGMPMVQDTWRCALESTVVEKQQMLTDMLGEV
jgi:pyruvyltransferase